ncbi:hypothetical protein EDB83DRAFT_2517184 [Lactarius deliciosus]|nr:hypothetical protein EDB83DRAFT_2517184 [Lactarius deliciosus]
MALCDPTIFDFNQLFELIAVLIAQMHPLFVLWTFNSWVIDGMLSIRLAPYRTLFLSFFQENDPALWTIS